MYMDLYMQSHFTTRYVLAPYTRWRCSLTGRTSEKLGWRNRDNGAAAPSNVFGASILTRMFLQLEHVFLLSRAWYMLWTGKKEPYKLWMTV